MDLLIDPKTIFILIPSFNEGRVICSTIAPLCKIGYTIVVIDDCSTDDTEKVLKGLPVVYLKHQVNLGQGAAIQTGIDYALISKAVYVVTFDADGQHNFEEIPFLLQPILQGKVDITMGSRFKRKQDIAEIPNFRKIILRIAILVNGILTGMWLTDAHNGFRVMNRYALSKIKLKENKMAHATEILSQVKYNNLRFSEVPVKIIYTDYSKIKGQSSMNSINILIDLLLKKIF